jgi:Arc/MetJ-type ribon-helix-helix transcriptional regulator
VTANVSPENERYIQQAIAEGRFTSRDEAINQAVQLLRADGDVVRIATRPSTSTDEWIANLRNWAANHRPVARPVDFDRETIYSGRGE